MIQILDAGTDRPEAFNRSIFKKKLHYSCEIEDFGQTYICKLSVILRSRLLRDVHVLITDISWRLSLMLASTRVPSVIQLRSAFNKSAHGNYITRSEGSKSDGCGTHQLCIYQVY